MPGSGQRTLLERVRNQEYVGENRCVPCTVVNVVIALGASALVSFVSVELAVAVFVLSMGVIAVRGYVIPGTPTLTQRYLPERVLESFDHSTRESETGADTPAWDTLEKVEYERHHAVDPDQFLVEAGIVEPHEAGGDDSGETSETDRRFQPTEEFADRLERHLHPLRSESPGSDLLAAMFETEPEAVAVDDRDHPAITVESRVRHWPSESALQADVAAHESLCDLTDRWTDVPLEQRLTILESLRSVHDTCPGCGGELRTSAKTVDACCRASAQEVATVDCLACGDRLLELDPSAVGSAWPSDG